MPEMSRRLLILSTVIVLGGLLLMAYSDPAVTVALGGSTGVPTSFTFSGTRTVSFNFSRSFTINGTGGFPTGRLTGAGADNVVVVSTNTRVETFVGVGLLAVGILLEVFTLFLWQSPQRRPRRRRSRASPMRRRDDEPGADPNSIEAVNLVKSTARGRNRRWPSGESALRSEEASS